ncbi:MAG: Fic family protein [Opitutales bacterium]|nr:Fic family protein [Opitutales bacterium]
MDITPTHRAGTYRRQSTGYRAFYPAPLPPDPPIRIEGDFQRLLSQADRALGRLDGSIQILPNPDLFVLMYVRKEAVLSSQIEGTQSSLQDLLAAEAKLFTPNLPKDVNEVINYVDAMNFGLARLPELPLSLRLIREIHQHLLRNVRGGTLTPGEFRRSQNWIGSGGCTLNEATFVPPPPEEVSEALGALENFLHHPGDLPALVQIGLAHAQFETIHPFLDGNGRVGRLLITFFLCEQQILQHPVLYLSHFFKQHRNEYYERLQAVRDHGDWEGWLEFFVRGVLTVSKEATETARRILDLRETHRSQITEKLGRAAGNGHRILERLYQRPVLNVLEIERLLGITYAAANSLVSRLTALGILREITGQRRHRVFRYTSYLDLFGEGSNEPPQPQVNERTEYRNS